MLTLFYITFIDVIQSIWNLGGFISGQLPKQKCLNVMELSGSENQHNSSFLVPFLFSYTRSLPRPAIHTASLIHPHCTHISYINNHLHRLLCDFFYNFSWHAVCWFSLHQCWIWAAHKYKSNKCFSKVCLLEMCEIQWCIILGQIKVNLVRSLRMNYK